MQVKLFFAGGFQLFKKRYKNYGVDKAEFSMSNFLPYLCHYNENTVITKYGSLMTFYPFQCKKQYLLIYLF